MEANEPKAQYISTIGKVNDWRWMMKENIVQCNSIKKYYLKKYGLTRSIIKARKRHFN